MTTPVFVLVVICLVLGGVAYGYFWGRRKSVREIQTLRESLAGSETAYGLLVHQHLGQIASMDQSYEAALGRLNANHGREVDALRNELKRRDDADAKHAAVVREVMAEGDLLPCTRCGEGVEDEEWKREAGLCEHCALEIVSPMQDLDQFERSIIGLAGTASVSEQDAFNAGVRAGRHGADSSSAGLAYFRSRNLADAWAKGHAHGKTGAAAPGAPA